MLEIFIFAKCLVEYPPRVTLIIGVLDCFRLYRPLLHIGHLSLFVYHYFLIRYISRLASLSHEFE